MKSKELRRRLKELENIIGNLEVDLHVITNSPVISKAPIKGVINESSYAEEGKTIVKKIVIFGGKQYER